MLLFNNKYKSISKIFANEEFEKFIVLDENENKYELNRFVNDKEEEILSDKINLFEKNFPKIFDYFNMQENSKKYFCIVTELPNLRNFIKNSNFNESKIILIKTIIKKINECLKNLPFHSIPKIIKPENIFFVFNNYQTKDFFVKIIINEKNSKINENSFEENKYSAPEIFCGKENQKSFLWSVGLILFELYTKKYAFEAKDEIETVKNRNEGKIFKKIDNFLLNQLVEKLVQIDVEKRIDFRQYLNDDFFAQIVEIKLNVNFDNEKVKIFGNDFNLENINNFILIIDQNETKYQQIFDYLKKGIHEIKIKIYAENLSCRKMFKNCKNLIEIEFNNFFDVTDTSEMFTNCSSLKNVNLTDFSTNNVTNMKEMFSNCVNLPEIDLSSFNTKNVTDMNHMFSDCENLYELDLSSFDTNNVTDMNGMFGDCCNLTKIDLSNFNTEKVKDMNLMFYNCNNLISLDVSDFRTENVTNMKGMFYECCSVDNLNVENFDTRNVCDMSGMFYNCCNIKNLDVYNFNTSNVVDMSFMFSKCLKIKYLDLSNFNTKNVKKMNAMFSDCSSLKKLDIDNFSTENVEDFSYMFFNCSSLKNIINSGIKTENAVDMSYMFFRCLKLRKINVVNFNEEKEKYYLNRMFYKCNSVKNLDLSKFFIHSEADTNEMFVDCSSLKNVVLNKKNNDEIFDTKNKINFIGTKFEFTN